MNVALWSLWLRVVVMALVAIGIGLGIALALSGLYGDRARGRPRCPRCWFEMCGTPGLRCGECGRLARSERDLLRTRRRWWRAGAGVILSVTLGVMVSDEVQSGGWPRFLPSGVLVSLLPVAGGGETSMTIELGARLRSGRITDDQAMRYFESVMRGSWFASVPDAAWIRQYGPAAEVLYDHLRASDDEMVRARSDRLMLEVFRRVPPEVRIRSGSSVPAGMAISATVEVREWWLVYGEVRLEVEAMVPGTPRIGAVRAARIQPTHGFTMILPPMPPGEHEIAFHVRCARRAAPGGAWHPLPPEQVTARFVVVEGLQPIESMRSDALDEAVRAVFAGGLVQYGSGVLPVRIAIDRRPTFVPAFDGVAFGVEVEVRRSGVPVRHLTSSWLGGTTQGPRHVIWEVPWLDSEALARTSTDDDVWSLSVRSRADLAAQVEDAHAAWEGDIEMTVPLRRSSRRAPASVWLPWTDQE